MTTKRDVNIRLTVQDADKAVTALRALGTDGERALQRILAASAPADKALRRTSDAMDQAAAASQRLRGSVSNLGFQLTDAVVQLQGGANALIVLGQQGSQAAAAFGPLGVGIGTAVALAAAGASAFLGLGRQTDYVAKSNELLKDQIETSTDALARQVAQIVEADAATRQLVASRALLAQQEIEAGAAGDIARLADELGRRAAEAAGPALPRTTPGQLGEAEDFERSFDRAKTTRDAREALIAAVRSGKGHSEVNRIAVQSGLLPTDDAGLLDAIQKLGEAADSRLAEAAFAEAASTGRAPAGLELAAPESRGRSSGGRTAADRQADRISALAVEVNQLARLKTALDQGAEAHAAMEREIALENEARSLGISLTAAEDRATADQLRRKVELTGAIEATIRARKDEAALTEEVLRAVQRADLQGEADWQRRQDSMVQKAQRAAEQVQDLMATPCCELPPAARAAFAAALAGILA